MENSSKNWKLLTFLLLIKFFIALIVIAKYSIGLAPDEAQYWLWSKYLDWGYYSKPAGIAWQISLGTQIFGDTVLGVRFGAALIGVLLPMAMYLLAKRTTSDSKIAFWAGIIFAFSPIGILSSFAATTDGGYLLFWTLASAEVARQLNRAASPNYYQIGLWIGLGALFKWPIYLLWVLMALFRKLNKSFWLALGLSFLGLLPSLIWNWQHEWASFRHVGRTVSLATLGGEASSKLLKGNFTEFLGAQVGMLSPIYFMLLVASFYLLFKRTKEITRGLLFCLVTSGTILGLYVFFSIFNKMQGNWVLHAYPTGVVLLCFAALKYIRWGEVWLKVGLFLSLGLSLFALAIPVIQKQQIRSKYSIPWSWNLFQNDLGWEKLVNGLEAAGYDSQKHFLLGSRYQTSSILSFYSPGQKRAYFLNLEGTRKNQFSFWPSLTEEKGKDGFYMAYVKGELREGALHYYTNLLKPYFQEVEEARVIPLFECYGKVVKQALIIKCLGYRGEIIRDPAL